MKHTSQHAEAVFKKIMDGQPEDESYRAMRYVFVDGYMAAIKETNAPELLEALIKVSNINNIAREHINPELFIQIELLIKKATE